MNTSLIISKIDRHLITLNDIQETTEELLGERDYRELCDHTASIAVYLRTVKSSLKEKDVENSTSFLQIKN